MDRRASSSVAASATSNRSSSRFTRQSSLRLGSSSTMSTRVGTPSSARDRIRCPRLYDPVVAIGERYATEVGALWSGLARTLAELEQLASDPLQLAQEDADTLRVLQYRLHCAGEEASSLAPPRLLES